MPYRFSHVTTPELLEEVYRFRYRVMCEELGVIPSNDAQIESDRYDPYSDHFAAIDTNGTICAVVRLIRNSPVGYPTEAFCGGEVDAARYPRHRLGELSRIFIAPEHRNMRETRTFIRGLMLDAAYPLMREHDIEYCLGSLEKAFLKLLNMLKIPYRAIGERTHYNGADRYPSMLLRSDLERLNPELTSPDISQKYHN